MSDYAFRAHCDICNTASKWFNTPKQAKGWRQIHFSHQHPDNPMRKTNCRIQRYTGQKT